MSSYSRRSLVYIFDKTNTTRLDRLNVPEISRRSLVYIFDTPLDLTDRICPPTRVAV
jgi:hypothetical protein